MKVYRQKWSSELHIAAADCVHISQNCDIFYRFGLLYIYTIFKNTIGKPQYGPNTVFLGNKNSKTSFEAFFVN